jgi:hypothetical protein
MQTGLNLMLRHLDKSFKGLWNFTLTLDWQKQWIIPGLLEHRLVLWFKLVKYQKYLLLQQSKDNTIIAELYRQGSITALAV